MHWILTVVVVLTCLCSIVCDCEKTNALDINNSVSGNDDNNKQ